ncbi:MAG: YggT family protein [Clostridiales bacterium]|nr:YggT family protein [Clostridiales bacterium]
MLSYSVKMLLIQAVSWMSRLFYFLILIRCLLSWLPIDRRNKFADLVYTLTEPVLEPIRRLFDRSPLGGYGMRIDFSPVIAIILVEIVCNIIINIIYYV